MRESPVLELHRRAGATLGEAHGWRVPVAYAPASEEYGALTERAGLLDRSHVGRLRFRGADALDLLDRLSTNGLRDLAPDRGMYTVLTSNKGRVLDVLLVVPADGHLMVFTAPENPRKVADHIDFFTFGEDVAVEDVTQETAMLSLVGPRAEGVLTAAAGGARPSGLAPLACASATIAGLSVLVVRSDFLGLPCYDVVAPAEGSRLVWEALLHAGAGVGLKPVGADAADVVRVENGIPVYGRDMSEENNPLEAGLLSFVSFTKGCYVGQEVVTRLNTYKKVQRQLVGLAGSAGVAPESGTKLFKDGAEAGIVTSAVRPPRRDGWLGLGYVRKGQAQAGTRLALGSPQGEREAEVVELPLNR